MYRRGLRGMLRLEQQPNRDIGEHGMGERVPEIEEIWTGCPGKIMDVFLIVLMGRGAIGVVANIPLHAGLLRPSSLWVP